MPRHFERFIADRPSPGLIIISQTLPVGMAANWLYLIWSASEAGEYINSI
jgi:hypothetical protein